MSEEKELKKVWPVKKVGFGKKPMIINIDMQDLYTDPESPVVKGCAAFHLIEQAVKNQNALFEAARKKNVQLAHTVIQFRDDNKDAAHWKIWQTCDTSKIGSKWTKLSKYDVRPEDIYFGRNVGSAFAGTQLRGILIAQSFDTLIITGSNTSGCIRATANDSFMNGFRTIVVSDCCADFGSEQAHWDNLRDLDCRYADVVNHEKVLEYIDKLPMQEFYTKPFFVAERKVSQ